MIPLEYPLYDFRAASKVERPLAAALKIWQKKFSLLLAERWKEIAPTEIQVSPMLINAMTFEAARARWDHASTGVAINIKDNSVQGLLIAQRADLLILMMEIFSESLTARPADRELTTIEIALSQLFFQNAVATFGDAWPDKEPMPMKVKELDAEPKYSRMFPPQKEVLVTGFTIRTSGGSDAGPAKVEWIFAKEELRKLLGVAAVVAPAADGVKIPVENITTLVVEVAARLGMVELEMSELMALGEGDIVKLDQPIKTPLTLYVNQHPSLRAWPGRNGEQRCLMIE